ncbi:PH domain-containing protein [Candidatus Altiarchaeota archaeon]
MTEECVWKGGLAPGSLIWYWVIGLFMIMTLLLSPFGLLVIVLGALKMNRWKYEVTNERIKVSYGFLSTTKREADLDRIQDIIVVQGVMGKMLGYGDLHFNTAGSAGYEITFSNVANPEGLKEKFRELRKTNKVENKPI